MPSAAVSGPDGPSPDRKTVYLVTGASRGLGRGLVQAFLLRPNSIVIAGLRNRAAQASALDALPRGENSSLIAVQLDSGSKSDPTDAVSILQRDYGIRHLDVVIANAAIAANYGPASTMPLEYLDTHMQINAYAVLLLFQATRVLLQAAASPQFICVGAPISTITEMESCARAPLTNYALSKLAACYLVRKLHFENKWLVAYIVDPGHIQSDMGAQAARLFGRKEAPTTIEESVAGICARMAEADKDTTSGRFILFSDGSDVPW
ncbi:putative sterigmatocystin biosynthesis ketoreductase stcE [Aspergillus nidulans var. acristatus]|uniref:Putative norsolorinic acid reductase n=1 Tax=Aspergillus pachycristatus TaxID=1810921 RepID=A0A5P8H6A0_9EURO|nr:putative norsolorinic acid reductase [Aspergillus pachycristatus]